MSRKRRERKQEEAAAAAAPAGLGWSRALSLLALAAVGIVIGATWRLTGSPSRTPASGPTEMPVGTTMDGGSAVAKGPVPKDLELLKGKWVRGDGGYVLEINDVDAQGKLTARYLNPKPINVARAEASQQDGTTRVFVELRDVNYPGSTYELAWDKEHNRLIGVYFQAAQQQHHKVFFEKLK